MLQQITTTLLIVIVVGSCSNLTEVFQGYSGYDPTTEAKSSISLPHKSFCLQQCLSDVSNCTGFIFTDQRCHLYDELILTPQPGATGIIFVKTSKDIYAYSWVYSTLLARDKPASMSSASTHPASRGNDGLIPSFTDATGEDSYTFSAGRTTDAWWRVDMLEAYNVTGFYFVARGHNQYWSLCKNVAATVSVLETDIFSASNRCGYHAGVVERFANWINCTTVVTGQFAQLQLFLTEAFYLQLYEVEVHGYEFGQSIL